MYEFNDWLSQFLFIFSGRLEQFIKSTFIESLCQQYNGKYQKGECYLDETIYENFELYNEFISIIEKHLSENQSLSIQHHIKNKGRNSQFGCFFQEMTFWGNNSFYKCTKKKNTESIG